MSYTSPFSSIVISPLADGQAELLDRVPQESASGWESLRDTWLLRNDAAGNDPVAALVGITALARGAQLSGLNMWIVSRSARVVATGLFKVEVNAMGLLSARGYKVTYDAAAAGQSAENIEVASTLYAKVATREGGVTANFEYIAVASVAPTDSTFLTKWTGRAKSLPSGWSPTVPATIWDYLTVYTFNYPNGWIFEAAAMENLPGLATVFLIKEKYVYQFEKTPG
jgi:hypothetical protein